MIYLLHGSDTVSSRNFLLRLKEQYQTSNVINVKKLKGGLDLPSEQFFGQKNLLVLENAIPKNAEQVVPTISSDVVIWLTESLENVPSWVEKNLHFQLTDSVSTFKLADLIFLGQEKQALSVLGNLTRNNTALEMIIGSLTRQIRLINLVIEGQEELVSKSSFVVKKSKDQAKLWSKRKLKQASMVILKADLSLKKGLLPKDLILTKMVMDLCGLAKA